MEIYISSILTSLISYILLNISNAEILLDPEPTEVQSNRVPCPDVEHVCASLMKMGDVISTEESEYCACSNCKLKWTEDDGQSLSWYHYERSDWQVQYKFCENIMPKYECREPSEVAAVIRTDAKGWNLRIKKLFCSCPKQLHYLQGWNLAKDSTLGTDTWDYHYICDRPVCELKQPCVKHYIKGDSTVAYKFPCTCPAGYSCDTSKSKDEEIDGNDNAGPYIQGFCKKVNQANREISIRDEDEDEEEMVDEEENESL